MADWRTEITGASWMYSRFLDISSNVSALVFRQVMIFLNNLRADSHLGEGAHEVHWKSLS